MKAEAVRFQLSEQDIERLPQAAEFNRLKQTRETKLATALKVPERRRDVRIPLNSEELLAPCDGEIAPALHEFKFTRCRDISASGFSFYSDAPPEYKYVVVGIRFAEEMCWLKARVVHDKLEIYEGRRRYVVGCEFTEKFEPSSK